MSTLRPNRFPAIDDIARAQRRLAGLRRNAAETGGTESHIWEPTRVDGDRENQGRPLNLSVRSVRLRDLPALLRSSNIHLMNQPEVVLYGHSAIGSGLRAVAPGGKSRPRIFVASAEDKRVGFVQFQPAYSDRRWHAIALGTATGVYDSWPVEDEILRFAITAAGLRGVKRLYARIQSGSDLVNSFCRVGFAPFATETVFVAESPTQLEQTLRVRKQEQSDTWAIHQLYNATAPRTVQYAEALTSHRWDLSGVDELSRSSKRLGWVAEDGQSTIAYGRVSCGSSAHSMELLYLPDHTTAIGGLIDTILRELKRTSSVKRVYCTLRGYQVEAAKELESRGFEPILEQDLLVKYTTAVARVPQPEPFALHTEVIERLPKRVPSFLQQKPPDEVTG